jgi:hypothetical protein
MANGALPQRAPGGADAKEQEFVDKLDIFIRLLQLLANKRPTILSPQQSNRLQIALVDLRRIMAQSGATPSGKPLPVQNNTVAIELVVVLIIVGVAILALASDPTWRQNAKRFTEGLIQAATRAVEGVDTLLSEGVQVIVDGVVEINQKAYEITSRTGKCKDGFAELEKKATQLVFDLAYRRPMAGRTAEAFVSALIRYLLCLGLESGPILELLRRGWQAGLTLIDLLVKLAGGNVLLPSRLGL